MLSRQLSSLLVRSAQLKAMIDQERRRKNGSRLRLLRLNGLRLKIMAHIQQVLLSAMPAPALIPVPVRRQPRLRR